MTDRPLGVSVACALIGLVSVLGLLGSIATFAMLGRLRGGELASAPQSVQLFLQVLPVFMLVLGLLGMFAAVRLWHGSPTGWRAALVWIGLWGGQELAMLVWAATGSRVVRDAVGGAGGNLLRLVVAGTLFVYVWTVGRTYVADGSAVQETGAVPSDP